MSWQVVDRMTIYHESGMYALSPTVTRTPAGSLLVTFQEQPIWDIPIMNTRYSMCRHAGPKTKDRHGAERTL